MTNGEISLTAFITAVVATVNFFVWKNPVVALAVVVVSTACLITMIRRHFGP